MLFNSIKHSSINGNSLIFKTLAKSRNFSSTIKCQNINLVTPKDQLPYFIQRTQFKSLPIYTEFRNNGSRKLTMIRKVEGNIGLLKSELDKIFGSENVVIKKINNSIVIKGICVREVRQFLTKKGF
ncbi:hypothetical protein BB558_002178 [Smittium angustum]|uniref:Large ribosomal subunit protein mL49 n=1 Tax=Smittium angustum TaxID=133377 RepID=A0A2U1IUT6_SMIAN|nr:hypothetical protein BB558_007512 [Smittium angustum]PWA01697.1 hypothetical protein BB558_002178 [Smittium angustum]